MLRRLSPRRGGLTHHSLPRLRELIAITMALTTLGESYLVSERHSRATRTHPTGKRGYPRRPADFHGTRGSTAPCWPEQLAQAPARAASVHVTRGLTGTKWWYMPCQVCAEQILVVFKSGWVIVQGGTQT